MKLIVLSAVVCLSMAAPDSPSYKPAHPPHYSHPSPPAYKPSYEPDPYHEPKHEEPKPYAYDYAVNDHYSGATFAKNENSDGHNTQGYYSVALPDGRVQHVKYVADHYDGFNAEVTYEGEASYPEYKPSYEPKYKPVYKPAPPVYKPEPAYKPVYKPAPPVYKPEPAYKPVYKPAPPVYKHKPVYKPAY